MGGGSCACQSPKNHGRLANIIGGNESDNVCSGRRVCAADHARIVVRHHVNAHSSELGLNRRRLGQCRHQVLVTFQFVAICGAYIYSRAAVYLPG